MTKNQKRLAAIMVLLLAAFTVIAFAMPFEKNGMFWLSYLFGMIAIAVQIYVMKAAFEGGRDVKSRFYGFPIAKIGVLYMILQLVLSLIFMAVAAWVSVWIAVILYMVLLVIAAIGFIGAETMRDEVVRQEVTIRTDTRCIRELRSRVAGMAAGRGDAEAKKALEQLAEEFRYSDPVSSEALKTIEMELKVRVTDLQKAVANEDANLIGIECKKVAMTLAERNRLCKLNKE